MCTFVDKDKKHIKREENNKCRNTWHHACLIKINHYLFLPYISLKIKLLLQYLNLIHLLHARSNICVKIDFEPLFNKPQHISVWCYKGRWHPVDLHFRASLLWLEERQHALWQKPFNLVGVFTFLQCRVS